MLVPSPRRAGVADALSLLGCVTLFAAAALVYATHYHSLGHAAKVTLAFALAAVPAAALVTGVRLGRPRYELDVAALIGAPTLVIAVGIAFPSWSGLRERILAVVVLGGIVAVFAATQRFAKRDLVCAIVLPPAVFVFLLSLAELVRVDVSDRVTGAIAALFGVAGLVLDRRGPRVFASSTLIYGALIAYGSVGYALVEGGEGFGRRQMIATIVVLIVFLVSVITDTSVLAAALFGALLWAGMLAYTATDAEAATAAKWPLMLVAAAGVMLIASHAARRRLARE
jgi:hypothetical protein